MCTPFEYGGTQYNDGCADYYGDYKWCRMPGKKWQYCGPCLDDVANETVVAKDDVVAEEQPEAETSEDEKEVVSFLKNFFL